MTTDQRPYVYPNQVKAWAQVEDIISGAPQSRVILQAEPQVGKTSFMVHGAIERAKRAKSINLEWLTIIAISDSNNALRNQTQADLDHALKAVNMMGDRHRIVVEHRSNLQHLTLPNRGMLTVFTDEAHIAAAMGAQRDRFQQRVYDHPGDRLLVDVGATSFAHVALHDRPDSPYDAIVRLEPGPAYNSVSHMWDMGRIQQVKKLFDKKSKLPGFATPFLLERLANLRQHGGYTVIRATGKRHDAVVDAIRCNSMVPIIEADMFKHPTAGAQHIAIDEIPKQLCTRPERPTILLVRGALRVGIVLPPEASANICEMVDTNAVRADTVTQSFTGRSCGYHKRDDKYIIFTNLREIEVVVDFYNEVQGAIPLGLKNSGAEKSGRYEIVPRDVAMARRNGPEQVQISVCSANNENDMADHVLRNINTWRDRLVFIDAPNPKFLESWNKLFRRHPEFMGKHLTFNAEQNWYQGAEVSDEFIDLGYLRPTDDEVQIDDDLGEAAE